MHVIHWLYSMSYVHNGIDGYVLARFIAVLLERLNSMIVSP